MKTGIFTTLALVLVQLAAAQPHGIFPIPFAHDFQL